MSGPIRHRQLKELVRAAASLPGPRLELTPWARVAQLDETAAGATATTATRLRALVAEALERLARRIDEVLPPALARARQTWESIDDLAIVDDDLAAWLTTTRQTLVAAATGASGPERAVALEGLLALDAARGLTGLAAHGLASLIRLRVRGQNDDLLPGGRPFLDLGAALAEAARAWD